MAPVKEYSAHPLEIHQARCEPTSGNLHFSAPPFWHLTTFGWPHKWLATQVFFSGRGLMLHFEPFQTFSTPLSGSTGSQNEARAAQILQHIQGTWGILGNKTARSLLEGFKHLRFSRTRCQDHQLTCSMARHPKPLLQNARKRNGKPQESVQSHLQDHPSRTPKLSASNTQKM